MIRHRVVFCIFLGVLLVSSPMKLFLYDYNIPDFPKYSTSSKPVNLPHIYQNPFMETYLLFYPIITYPPPTISILLMCHILFSFNSSDFQSIYIYIYIYHMIKFSKQCMFASFQIIHKKAL